MTGKMKTLGYVFILFGVVLVVGTIGRSDWQDFTPDVRPEEIIPFWRLALQAGIGMIMLYLGLRFTGGS